MEKIMLNEKIKRSLKKFSEDFLERRGISNINKEEYKLKVFERIDNLNEGVMLKEGEAVKSYFKFKGDPYDFTLGIIFNGKSGILYYIPEEEKIVSDESTLVTGRGYVMNSKEKFDNIRLYNPYISRALDNIIIKSKDHLIIFDTGANKKNLKELSKDNMLYKTLELSDSLRYKTKENRNLYKITVMDLDFIEKYSSDARSLMNLIRNYGNFVKNMKNIAKELGMDDMDFGPWVGGKYRDVGDGSIRIKPEGYIISVKAYPKLYISGIKEKIINGEDVVHNIKDLFKKLRENGYLVGFKTSGKVEDGSWRKEDLVVYLNLNNNYDPEKLKNILQRFKENTGLDISLGFDEGGISYNQLISLEFQGRYSQLTNDLLEKGDTKKLREYIKNFEKEYFSKYKKQIFGFTEEDLDRNGRIWNWDNLFGSLY